MKKVDKSQCLSGFSPIFDKEKIIVKNVENSIEIVTKLIHYLWIMLINLLSAAKMCYGKEG